MSMTTKTRRSLGKLTLFESREIFGGGLWGTLQSCPLESHGLKHGVGLLGPEPSDELIGVDGLDVKLPQNRRRKIAQVEGDDEPGSAVNRCRQDMAVLAEDN
jgi:hypothetical protein